MRATSAEIGRGRKYNEIIILGWLRNFGFSFETFDVKVAVSEG